MYDFANTIFSFAILTFYFNDWLIDDMNAPDWYIGATGFVVAIALILTLTPMGAVADVLGRRKPFLIAFTLLCVTATAVMGFVDSVAGALVCLGVANFCYQSALSHYDPLLAEVAPPERQGRISGIGVAVGYVGTIAALPYFLLTVDGKQEAFLPTAVMFLVFALPCFVLVRERGTRSGTDSLTATMRGAMFELATTIRNLRQYRTLGRFLLARFLYVDAMLTVISYMTVYLHRVGGWEGDRKWIVVMFANAFAITGALLAGFLVDRVGPKRVLIAVLSVCAPTLALTGLIGTSWMMWIAGPVTGATLGTIWTADRVLMMRLTTPESRGEFFGVYNLVGKISSGVGPLVLWGGTVWLVHSQFDASKLTASRTALGMLALATLLGCMVVAGVKVPDAKDVE
jgi:UMF1 family MFS transporter